MAVVVDRASLFVDQIIKSFRPVGNTLMAIGAFYCAKKLIQISYTGFRFLTQNKPANFTWYPTRIWSSNHTNYCLIILNNEIINQERVVDLWNRASFRVLVDGAANSWFDLFRERKDISNPIPDLVTGDFDSIQPNVKDFYEKQMQCNVIETKDQDYTDFTKSLQQISQNMHSVDITEIYAFVEYGGRLDHVMGLFETLFHATKINKLPNVFLISSYTTDWLLQPGLHVINLLNSGDKEILCNDKRIKPRHCGIIPIGEPCTRIETSGLKWNLEVNQTLAFGKLVSTSNECCSDPVIINNKTPVIWTMEN